MEITPELKDQIDTCGNALARSEMASALMHAKSAARIAEEHFGSVHRMTAKMLTLVGMVYYLRKDYTRTLEWALRAFEIHEENGFPIDADSGQACRLVGDAFLKNGNAAAAVTYLKKATKCFQTLSGTERLDLGRVLVLLGSSKSDSGDLAGGILDYAEALHIFEAHLGLQNLETARVRAAFGMLHYQRQDYQKAFENLDSARCVFERELAKDAPEHYETCYFLGLVCHEMKQWQAAIQWHTRALAVCENIYGIQSPKTARTLSSLADALREIRAIHRALTLYARALAIQEETGDSGILFTLVGMAAAFSAKGDFQRGSECLERLMRLTAENPPTDPVLKRRLVLLKGGKD